MMVSRYHGQMGTRWLLGLFVALAVIAFVVESRAMMMALGILLAVWFVAGEERRRVRKRQWEDKRYG